MKALVTGGAGFIGSHLCQALCARGVEVVALDNFSLGKPENLAWRAPGDPLHLVSGDLLNFALVRELIRGCDWVFHQAALPSVPLSIEKPWESNQFNLDGTLNLLIAARDAQVKRFVFASSSAIYGDSSAPVKRESDPPNPMSPYALQKYGSEKYAQMFCSLYGLQTVSLRYFNVFGPRQSFNSPYSGVIARFCTALLAGETPVIFGDGKQARDFVSIANVVAANLQAAESPAEKVAGKVYNIATGESITLLDLLEELNRITGKRVEPMFAPARSGDVRLSKADISLARSDLRYEPAVSWREGLRETLQFYRDELNHSQKTV